MGGEAGAWQGGHIALVVVAAAAVKRGVMGEAQGMVALSGF